MRNNYIILAVATIISMVGAVLKIMHFQGNLGSILLGIGLVPYIYALLALVFSKANLNAARKAGK